MTSALELVGDPSRIHSEGMKARYVVEEAREQVANFLGAKPREVVFTSGATESISSAITGVMTLDGNGNKNIITTAIEHSCVLETCEKFNTKIIGVDKHGIIDVAELLEVLTNGDPKDIALVSLQSANHEIGTLQDIALICEHVRAKAPDCLIHIDAAQSIGRTSFDFSKIAADLVSISAHKFGAPKGVGALLIRQGLRIHPMFKGGSQERARRGGIENVSAIAGFGAVCESLKDNLEVEAEKTFELTNLCIELTSKIEGLTRYGHPEKRAPHIVCFGFEDVEPQAVLLSLDKKGVNVHSGSACSSEELQPSTVLEALGVNAERSLRVSVGWESTRKDIEVFSKELASTLKYLREMY